MHTHTHHITKETAPAFRREDLEEVGWNRVRLPDGTHAYEEMDPCGECGLYRSLVCRDYGGNEIRRCTAPALSDGVNAPVRGVPVRTSGEGLIGWVVD